MLMTIVSILFYTTLMHALPSNAGLDYLDPILHQEHVQSPNGHYKYGYESNKATAYQVHGSVGTVKGFDSYLDNQGDVQRVKYVAGDNGYKIVESNGSPVLSSFTPEVEAARKAHLDAYVETRSRDLAQQSLVKTKVLSSETAKKQADSIDTPLSIKIPLGFTSRPMQDHVFTNPATFDDRINLFSGQPLDSSYQNNYNFPNLPPINPKTISPRPPIDYHTTNVESKVFILPTPTVDHYEKIWPLPPHRFKDLEVKVNEQDWYDSRPKYFNGNHDFNPQFTEALQNINKNPFLNQLGASIRPEFMEAVSDTERFPQPNSLDLIDYHPATERLHNSLSHQQTRLKSLDFVTPSTIQLNYSIPPKISTPEYFSPLNPQGLTAHQKDLIDYKQGLLVNSNLPITGTINTDKNYNESSISRHTTASVVSPVIDVVTMGSIDVEKNIAALAARKAFKVLKEKYNLS